MRQGKHGFFSRLRHALFGGKTKAPAESLATGSPPASGPGPVTSTPKPAAPNAVAVRDERVVRVFVSSTFRDMVEDRNALMAQTWPALRKLCRDRSVEFVEVDLRWGITEEMSQRAETLRHCLAEIKRCRPYFIGLLGERYGWTPGPAAYSPALLSEERWLEQAIAQRSVTELEILHGVLNDPAMAGRAFFYYRDPAYAKRKGGDYQAEDTGNAQRQQDLKDRIQTVCRDQHLPLREGDQYRDPDTLTGLVLTDLTAAIEAEFPADRVPDVWVREARDHEAYAKSRRTRFYVGRDGYYDRLDAHGVNGANGQGLLVLGDSGGGKSALLANWVDRWRQAHPEDFVFQHYLGASPMSAGHLALLRRLMVAIIRWCKDETAAASAFDAEEDRLPVKTEDIVKALPEYLGRLDYHCRQTHTRAMLVLDALNQIEDAEQSRRLIWLPYRMPGAIRLIVSTLPGDTLDALQDRNWPTLTVEPLTPEERTRLIAGYLAHFSQALSDQRAQRIAKVPAAANPLYLKTLLDDLRATGAHDRLDDQIDDYLQAQDIPALFAKILERYEQDYQRDRPQLVRDALSLLWAARRGLTEAELLELLKPDNEPQLPAAFWSPIRCALAEGLIDRDGILAFGHDYLRQAVGQRYLPDQDTQDDTRIQLADYFEAQPITARSCDELPWLLAATECYDRLRDCLLDIERFVLIWERDQNELMGYWVVMGRERDMGEPYLERFEHWDRTAHAEPFRSAVVAGQLGYFLRHAGLFPAAEPLSRRALAGLEQALGPAHPHTLASVNNLAGLLQDQGDTAAAEPLYRRALAGQEQALGPDHPHTLTSISNLAGLLQDQGDTAAAEPLVRRALAGYEKALGPDHPHTLTSVNNLAGLLQDQGDTAAAEPLVRRALAGIEQALGPDHPDTLACVHNLAGLLQAQGDTAAAEPLVRRALAGREQALGPAHPHTLASVNNLARLLLDQGDTAAAEPLYRRALAGQEQALGPDHPHTLTSVSNLAGSLYAQGDYAAAEPLVRRALAGYEKALGPDHPHTLTSVNNLADLLYAKGDFAAAERLFRRALAGQEQALGPDPPATLLSVNSLALLLNAQGDTAAAEPLFRRALAGREQALGPDHPDTLISVNSLALLLEDQGDLGVAEPLFRRALAGREQALGPAHPDTLGSVNNLASLLHSKGDYATAEPLYRRALAGQEQALGPDHPDTLASVHNLAYLLKDQGDYAAAEPLFRRALEGLLGISRANGRAHPNLQPAVNNYAENLQKLGRSEQEIRAALRELAPDFFGEPAGSAEAKSEEITPAQARQFALEWYKAGQYEDARALLEQLLKIGFEVLSTRLHLARIALLTDDLTAAQGHVAEVWAHRAEAPPYVVGRILWFQVAFALLEGASPAPFLGRLKTALQAEGAHMDWTMDPVLAHLQSKLSPEAHALLTALVAALSDPANLARLDDFPEWRAATPLPLD